LVCGAHKAADIPCCAGVKQRQSAWTSHLCKPLPVAAGPSTLALMTAEEWTSLVEHALWPAVVLVLGLVLRKPIGAFLGALAGRVTKPGSTDLREVSRES
jgi:hypothetical protein